jgi:hypothetical protein
MEQEDEKWKRPKAKFLTKLWRSSASERRGTPEAVVQGKFFALWGLRLDT